MTKRKRRPAREKTAEEKAQILSEALECVSDAQDNLKHARSCLKMLGVKPLEKMEEAIGATARAQAFVWCRKERASAD